MYSLCNSNKERKTLTVFIFCHELIINIAIVEG